VSTTASNEATLEFMLQKVIDLWMSTDFRLVTHSSGSSIITGADDIIAMLEESLVTISTLRGSRYIAPIKVSFLQLISFVLFDLLRLQDKWFQ
jgi:dynein heavy chain